MAVPVDKNINSFFNTGFYHISYQLDLRGRIFLVTILWLYAQRSPYYIAMPVCDQCMYAACCIKSRVKTTPSKAHSAQYNRLVFAVNQLNAAHMQSAVLFCRLSM